MTKFPGLSVNVVKIVNNFFGETVTVAGLITGEDFKAQLKDIDLGDALLIPAVSLRKERDKFLDDVTLEELSEYLGIQAEAVENDGYSLLEKIIGGV
jgi:NifB/MoaA-like Fe-S oxidoreductase